ncbi:centrosomal protein of 85 kDa-like isoform X2 [Mastacembelus armatus]|uniref:centrosomal protein of 85 kDa-like isoform X2 n=1 Tax=Mastacembelus armatus TaxID=205130 RepID=UPI000E45D26F|nr:centrosomal protein of 85 kDa-like isoform X2 [Mastacembelus armatus]
MCYRSALGHEYKSTKTDNAGSSTISLSSQPMSTHHLGHNDDAIGIVHGMPSPFSSPNASFKIPASPTNTGCWSRSCQLLMPITSPLGAPNCLDMKDHQPIRRWSSLNKLSCGSDKSCTKTDYLYNPDLHGSLDRSLYGYRKELLGSNMDLYLPLSSSLPCSNLCLSGAGPCYHYNYDIRSTDMETGKHLSTALSSSVKHNSLDINYSALPEAQRGRLAYGLSVPKEAEPPLYHQTDRGSSVQPAVLTQMWLSEQMQYRTKAEHGYEVGQISGTGTECYGGGGPHWQEPGNQMLMGASLPANTLVKIKEGLLRKRELEIDRQKQQILQLHVLIRKNELRAQHVLQSQRGCVDHPYILNNKVSMMKTSGKQPFSMLHCNEGCGRRLEMAELEIIHLNEFFKQATQKYTEDIRKLEEKIRTRNRYISSLKKKCQRESEQNQEKQQRIETLEKYLSDLPTLEKHKEKQQKAKDLEKKISWLQKNLEDGCALMKEKDIKIEMQAKREQELIGSVHSLQQKVQQCLDDGVRLPMQDLKQLEVENTQLLDQQDHSSWLIEHQKEQIDRLTLQLLFPTEKLQDADEGRLVHPPCSPELGQLLKEMSLCLPDLQALCSILAERAEGKEPNLSLLLGLKSLSVPAEDSDCRVMEEMKFKLLQVGQLRRDIEELRKSISNHCA